MKKLLVLLVLWQIIFVGLAFSQSIPEIGYGAMLSEDVKDGRVDYPLLCKDQRLDAYLASLAQTDPEQISGEANQLAFWINVYNAYNLKIVCMNYPFKNLADLNFGGIVMAAMRGQTIWDKPIAVVNQRKLTLKAVEHDIIRKKFNDPKLQFALACGVRGCPDLRPELYQGQKLQQQLIDQAKIFLNGAAWNSFDLKTKKAELSSILNWNRKYFGKNEEDVLRFIGDFVPEPLSQSLKDNSASWTVKYRKYDLNLNDKNF
jgi:hypothetical protein